MASTVELAPAEDVPRAMRSHEVGSHEIGSQEVGARDVDPGAVDARAWAARQMAAEDAAPDPVTPDEIRERAYDLWERHHRPEGYEIEFWIMAERELWAERRRTGGTDAPAPRGRP